MKYNVTIIFPPIPEVRVPRKEIGMVIEATNRVEAARRAFAARQDVPSTNGIRSSAMAGDVIVVDDAHYIVWENGMKPVSKEEADAWMTQSFAYRALTSIGIDISTLKAPGGTS